jgi:hypothetical protein
MAGGTTSDVTFAIAISAGGVAVATILVVWLRSRNKREGK